MLATPCSRLPTGEEWVHEVKWDGMRVLADVTADRVRLTSRTEKDVTVSFPELAGPGGLAGLAGRDLLLDGEVVVLDDEDGGRPSFARLGQRMHVGSRVRAGALAGLHPVTFLLFDVLRLDGHDLTDRAWTERRRLLESLGPGGVHWQAPAVHEDGPLLWELTGQQRLEGVVSKRRESRYEPGVRSRSWMKRAHRHRVSYVIGGWRPEVGSTTRLGAVLVGSPSPAGLAYRGRVGSGIAGRAGTVLLDALRPLAAEACPFVTEVPPVDRQGTVWVEPVLVVDVESHGVTRGDRLRQPSYRGLRTDLTAQEVGWEG